MNKVKSFPYSFCEGCMLNGCYPWNKNPALCCINFGGLIPSIIEWNTNLNLPTRCASYKPVTDDVWKSYLKDMKWEAQWNEEMRRKAMEGEVSTNQLLPEHIFQSQEKGNEIGVSSK